MQNCKFELINQNQIARHCVRLLMEIDSISNPNKNYMREGHYPCFYS